MKNLDDRQREMRGRNAQGTARPAPTPTPPDAGVRDATSEVVSLKRRITDLEQRLVALEAENKKLRAQKTIVVDRTPQKSHEDSVKEQQHNFFKYSNARRY